MKDTILAIFSSRENAEEAIHALQAEGYNPKDFSIIARDSVVTASLHESTGAHVAEGAMSGATTGGAIGAIAGLLVGIGAITIPGVGALLIGGPLVAALGLTGAAASTASGALTGALAGGLVGALVSLGVPKSDAEIYEQRIKEGGILVAVPTRVGAEGSAREVLEAHGAEQLTTVAAR